MVPIEASDPSLMHDHLLLEVQAVIGSVLGALIQGENWLRSLFLWSVGVGITQPK